MQIAQHTGDPYATDLQYVFKLIREIEKLLFHLNSHAFSRLHTTGWYASWLLAGSTCWWLTSMIGNRMLI